MAAAVGVWGTPQIVAGSDSAWASAGTVPCVSAGNCSAGGYYTNSHGGFVGLVVDQSGGTWDSGAGVAASPNDLSTISGLSATDAWAVGFAGSYAGLIVQWNAKAWKQVPGPSLGASPDLEGVAATSAGDAWAVGLNSTSYAVTILHSNRKAWTRS